MFQIFWKTLILLRTPGPHTCSGLFSAHIWFCLDLDQTHVGLNQKECRVGFRVCGPEILVVQKCFIKSYSIILQLFMLSVPHIQKLYGIMLSLSNLIKIYRNLNYLLSWQSLVNTFPSHHHSSPNYIRTHNAYCIILIQTVRVL